MIPSRQRPNLSPHSQDPLGPHSYGSGDAVQMKLPETSRNIPQEPICNWERKEQPKWSFPTLTSVVSFSWGKGAEKPGQIWGKVGLILFISSL